MVFVIRNYNRFLMGDRNKFEWVDLYIHRFPKDFAKLVKFDNRDEAVKFINDNPKIEKDWDAWVIEEYAEDWK